MALPRLEIYPNVIEANARAIGALVRNHGGVLAGVGKVLCAHPAAVDALVAGGVDMYADSRIDNLAAVQARGLGIPLLQLRLPEPSRVADVVAHSDLCLASELDTMRALAAEARAQRREYGVIVMVDLGDLREGVWDERVVDVVAAAARLDGLTIRGIGANLADLNGIAPSTANMARLVTLLGACRAATDLPLELVSASNSSSLDMLAAGTLPRELNHFRMGESIILGRNVLDRSAWPGTRQDGVRVVAEVIECERKPSVPVGNAGEMAFGDPAPVVDRGVRRRAILALGRQDVVPEGLTPTDPGVIILGASSDHLVLDVEEAAAPVRVGDELAFLPSYAATLALATSPYVAKVAR